MMFCLAREIPPSSARLYSLSACSRLPAAGVSRGASSRVAGRDNAGRNLLDSSTAARLKAIYLLSFARRFRQDETGRDIADIASEEEGAKR